MAYVMAGDEPGAQPAQPSSHTITRICSTLKLMVVLNPPSAVLVEGS